MITKSYKCNEYRYLLTLIVFGLVFFGVQERFCEIDAAGLTRINILPNVQVNSENILLGKIARIESHDSLLAQKLSNIKVAKAPLPGRARTLEYQVFILRLKQNGIDPTQLALHIPAKVVITRNYIEISREKIKMLVTDYIQTNILNGFADGNIKDIQVVDNLQVPNGRITFKVVPPRNRELLGKIPFTVHFDVNGKFYKRVWVTATIEVLAEVVITKKPLGRYKPITEDDIELQKMDLAKLPSGVITDPEAVLGKRTKRAIGAKTALRTDLVEFPPLVKRGDAVVIIAESSGLKITALGQAKKRGRLGERIPVVNYDSKKILYARVLDSTTVKVEF
ncbi:MAG: flagellar basal body P-ring formation chaperone FlgA [Desulfobacterales bacterium]|jgi:flagella basal body P-ring formation protein FlgA